MLRHLIPLQRKSVRCFSNCFLNINSINISPKKLVISTRTSSSSYHTSPQRFFERNNSSFGSYNESSKQINDDIDFDEIFADEEYYSEENNVFNMGKGQFNKNNDDYGINLDDVKSEFSRSVFKKNFYEESSITRNRTKEETIKFLKENSIEVSGQGVPQPVLSLEELDISDEILNELKKNNIVKPSAVQSVTWPATLSGRNVIGIAQTGSGKTLSFLLPALIHIAAQPKPQSRQGPITLVLCPTRELAKQCEKVARTFFSEKLRTTCLFGGGERARQVDDLNNGCDLVVATPGRLMDLLSQRCLTLNRCTFLVLDEADRMLDMGFEPQIRKIINLIRPDRQVTMWSATWPKEVRELASTYLRSDEDPVRICVGSSELTANSDVHQKFIFSSSDKKKETFFNAVKSINEEFKQSGRTRRPKMLVFCNTKASTDHIAHTFKRAGMKAEAIHGDIAQTKRDYIMRGFRKNFFPVLVATDVAARGLDVDNIDYVFNYDAPLDSVTYIHRIGRTGRAGNKGTSITILSQTDGGIVAELIKGLQAVNQPIDETLRKMQDWWERQKKQKKVHLKQSRSFGYNERPRRNSFSNHPRSRYHSRGNDDYY